MWNELSRQINDYLDNITIADLMRKRDQQCPVEESAQDSHPSPAKNADMSINLSFGEIFPQ